MLSKREMIYGGVALIIFLVIYSSTRKEELIEVNEENQKKSFDNSKLPKILQPPKKLAEGEPIPKGAKREKQKSLMPRFDSW
jgi:hypothetical protein